MGASERRSIRLPSFEKKRYSRSAVTTPSTCARMTLSASRARRSMLQGNSSPTKSSSSASMAMSHATSQGCLSTEYSMNGWRKMQWNRQCTTSRTTSLGASLKRATTYSGS